MRVETFESHSDEETVEIGKKLAASLHGVVLLRGDLGAGKTTLVRGIVSAIPGTAAGEVSSPTFTLIHDYGSAVFHIDLYRLDTGREIATLGLDDIFEQADLVLVEWGERLGSNAPSERTEITIENRGESDRRISVHRLGQTDAAGN